ncbi:hypothetical protein [Bradyrhizobium prioriisuperbiae]|uniref:hypothetical protein n=1 Tax=Bradyrhizobium prioriisuperbiae TaxID=2854389 RepID=UPI0028E88637|nr:hypothetical protein [Bradyrhizobium prioritasuperba]
MTDEFFELHAFLERDGELKPLYLRISPASLSSDQISYSSCIHAPLLFTKDTNIHGFDADQARSLAAQFVKNFLGEERVIDDKGRPIDW